MATESHRLALPAVDVRKLATEQAAAAAFVAAIAGAEILGELTSVVAGAAVDGLVLVVLLNAALLGLVRPASLLPPVLALVPLMRILSVALPLKQMSQLAWYPLVGVPLLLGIALAARTVGHEQPAPRSRWISVPVQLAVALLGIPLGAAAYSILHPAPIQPLTVRGIVLATVVLFLFAALVEELIFRRLLQDVIVRLFGTIGILFVSALYASTFAGSMSGAYIAFMGAVGLGFALTVRWTGGLWGVIVAHTFLLVGLLVVWPALGV